MRRLSLLAVALVLAACAGSQKAIIQPVSTANTAGIDYARLVTEAEGHYLARADEKELRQSISMYEIAYAMRPTDAFVLDRLAVAYYQLGYAYTTTDAGKIANHERGLQFALKRLELDPGYKKVVDSGGSMVDAVAKITDPRYVHALQFAAANWGWVGEKKGISSMAFDIPKVKALFERAMALDPAYLCYAPVVMAASYYAKAGAFGGDMDKAHKYFEEAIQARECYDNKMLYAEFYAIPTDNEELFHKLSTEVDQAPVDTSTIYILENRVAKEKAKKFLAKEAQLF